MMNFNKIMFFNVMMIGILLTLNSNNWFSMWMGMEINLIGFIPMLLSNKNNQTPEAMMIYFLIQSLGSMLFLMTILMSSSMMFNYNLNMTFNIMIIFSMMIKLAIPPTHFWLPMMIIKIDWINSFMLMTLQKIAPMITLSNISMMNNSMINITAMLSTFIGSISGINQTSIKLIMAYSSINHSGWMLICMNYKNELWMIYLLIYSMIILNLILMMNMNSCNSINQLSLNMNTKEKLLVILNVMSMGGLPPLLGFMNKLMVLNFMIKMNMMVTMTIMMMMSIIVMFYYMQMSTTLLMMKYMNNKWNLQVKHSLNKWMMTINFIMPMLMIMNLT